MFFTELLILLIEIMNLSEWSFRLLRISSISNMQELYFRLWYFKRNILNAYIYRIVLRLTSRAWHRSVLTYFQPLHNIYTTTSIYEQLENINNGMRNMQNIFIQFACVFHPMQAGITSLFVCLQIAILFSNKYLCHVYNDRCQRFRNWHVL